MQRRFDPREPLVAEFFRALGTDPLYVRMCLKQNCFRARLSAKPWRIGIESHLKPRPGVWPIAPERMPQRTRWIEHYDQLAAGYAACRLVEDLGSGKVDPDVRWLQQLHDDLSGARSGKPIA